MNLLYLTFYFEPDLGPGAFRNTSLVTELCRQLPAGSRIHVITTLPNRYQSYKPLAPEREEWQIGGCGVVVERVAVPTHVSDQPGQIRAFMRYFRAARRLTKHGKYDLVFASSSRLFTAFLGAHLARSKRVPLFLDIRDLFREAILDVLRNPFSHTVLNPVLRFVEQYTFRAANHINLVSEGFQPYFKLYSQATYSYFTNGIDDAFLDAAPLERLPTLENQIKTILYAGNIGEGQGLHKIIPQAARQLGDGYRFVIIGDGGARCKLEDAIQAEKVTNVDLRNPVSRTELVIRYQQADYLFLHLNDLDACKRVLPSKLFEYGATDKPILAGVTGFAASFTREYLSNSILFSPGDVENMVLQLRETPYRTEVRAEFRAKFQRKTISQEMARKIRQTLRTVPQ